MEPTKEQILEEQRMVAKTIVDQIKAFDVTALMAYGAKDFVALTQDSNRRGGLMFKVNGLRHKGWVEINLTWADLYQVKTSRIRKGERIYRDERDEVYFDELVTVLDAYVEGRGYDNQTTH